VSVTQQQVIDALAKVASPRGVALTNANVLSAITVTDGKVFFSINVDAAEARAWESVRGQAEAAVRAATSGLGVDVVLEMSGVPSAIHQAFALVRVGGRVQMLGIPAKPIEVDLATEIIFKGITVYGVVGRRMYDTWIQMTQFLRSGQFDPTPVITHRFPLEQFDEAIAAIRGGSAGKVVFEIA